ncbi:MAG TPA: UDP-galactopyranose mutase [Nitrosomonas sp.]|nr:UDP-galactopyranose mutase [Bacteroidota bacterium]HLP81772.1 UDP-galactopyranose mutase [Nitrosomonas sp.]
MKYDYLIVGAGFAGCVVAERLASKMGKKILLIDRRYHIGGNAYDSINEYGIRIQHYGPHLFHTNSEYVFSYLSHFAGWRHYEHRVLAWVHGKFVPMPVNRTTINLLFGYSFTTDDQVKKFYESERESIGEITNSEEFVRSKVGKKLYELLYKGYTTKQWGCDPSKLSPSVCGRLPVRTNTDDRYFTDKYQVIPTDGYASLFSRLTSHQNIHIEMNTNFVDVPTNRYKRIVFTGPIDEFFGYVYGTLPYRSLRFEFKTYDQEYVQSVAQQNYPNDFNYIRSTEYKHITGQKNRKTTISLEYPIETGDPYYPVPNNNSESIYSKYFSLAQKLQSVYFAGRLGTYRYYNMDQVVAGSLRLFEKISGNTF